MAPSPLLPAYATLSQAQTDNLVETLQHIVLSDPSVREIGCLLVGAPHLLSGTENFELPGAGYEFDYTSLYTRKADCIAPMKGIVGLGTHVGQLKELKPRFPAAKPATAEKIERVFEDMVKSRGKKYNYFNMDLSTLATNTCRRNTSFRVTSGAPLDQFYSVPGVVTPYGYYSPAISAFGAHLEDWGLASYNIVFLGATKAWVAVRPSSRVLFEQKIREHFPQMGKCTQFMRHLAIMITPALLREWGVEFSLIGQNPGQIVVVLGDTYHWGVNTGKNYAEAINIAIELDWEPPAHYEECYEGCGGPIPIPKPCRLVTAAPSENDNQAKDVSDKSITTATGVSERVQEATTPPKLPAHQNPESYESSKALSQSPAADRSTPLSGQPANLGEGLDRLGEVISHNAKEPPKHGLGSDDLPKDVRHRLKIDRKRTQTDLEIRKKTKVATDVPSDQRPDRRKRASRGVSSKELQGMLGAGILANSEGELARHSRRTRRRA